MQVRTIPELDRLFNNYFTRGGDSCSYESRSLQSPVSRWGEKRSLARDTSVSRMREFAVAGGRVVRGSLQLLPEGAHSVPSRLPPTMDKNNDFSDYCQILQRLRFQPVNNFARKMHRE